MYRFWKLSLCLVLLSAVAAQAAERRLLQPEDWIQSTRIPYMNEAATGWYAMEANCRAYGAPGGGYCVVIHENATNHTISTKLDKPLPPGKYKVFLNSMGLYWKDKTNILNVRVGNQTSKVEWDKAANKFRWFEGTTIELTKAADEIELEVEQFGGKSFAMLYGPNSRSIPVDQIYITSDFTEKSGPDNGKGDYRAMFTDRDAAADSGSTGGDYRTVNVLDTPAAFAQPATYPIRLVAHEKSVNLLPNSSFELGGGDGWSTVNNSRNQQTHIFTENDHLKMETVHGQYALRLPGKGSMFMQFSRVFHLEKDGVYTLSAYLKMLDEPTKRETKIAIVPIGSKNKLEEPLLLTGGQLTGEFQRFTATGELKAGPVMLAVYGPAIIDAAQLEAGTQATDYQPNALVEASLTTDQLGHIMYSDKPVTLTAWATNAGKNDTHAKLHYRIINVREEVIAEADLMIPVVAGQTVSKTITIDPATQGIFNVVYAAQDRPLAEGELIYSVLPPIPAGTPRHALASNMDNDPASLELMERMGHKWQLYCKIYADQPSKSNPKPGVYKWEDASVALKMPHQYGMQTMPALWPSRAPKAMQDPELSSIEAWGNGKRDMIRRIKSGKPVPFPDLDAWREYCKQLALNVGDDANWWTIEDETEMYYSAREFAKIVRATAEGFKASGKDMKISLSCMGDYTEEMIADLNGEVPLAGLGSSSYNYEYWEARKVRYLQERYNLPWSCIGVGVSNSPQFRRTGPFGQSVYGRTVRTAQEMVYLAIAQDAKVIGHYTGRIWMTKSLSNNDYPLMDYDGTPLVHGYAYSAIPLMVADAVPVKDVLVDKLGTMFFVYRQNGKLNAVTWSNNTPHLDIHWETDPKIWRDLTLATDSGSLAGKIVIADMFGNDRATRQATDPLAIKTTSDGRIVFDLTEEPTFIINSGLSDDQFMAMIQNVTAKPRDIAMRMAYIPDGKGGVDLGVMAQNNTGDTLTSLKLDANFPSNRMLTRTDWTLPDRNGSIDDIEANQQKWGRIKTSIDLSVPVENATYTTWLTQQNGSEHRMYDTCWLTVAPKLTAKVDGIISEWQNIQPAWMYYTYSWARFGRHNTQFLENGEHFKYVHRMDARASIYTSSDDKKLYVAVRCEDDDPIFKGDNADVIELHFNPKPGEIQGTQKLILRPDRKKVNLTWLDANGKQIAAKNIDAAMTLADDKDEYNAFKVWTIELAIPLEAIGSQGKSGQGIGFDLIWHDADHDGDNIVTGTWRWAGRSSGLGTLMFK